MPFTLSHAAAVLPVRRAGFITSAFVVGTFAPDFEYFLTLGPVSGYGHHWPGVLVFSLPASLAALWLFHAWIKRPAAALLPRALERRMEPYLGDFPFGGASRFAHIVLSIGAGIASHIVWDWFTHRHSWATRYWPGLLREIVMPWGSAWPVYKTLQFGCSILGLLALAAWFAGWLRETSPAPAIHTPGLRASHKLAIVSAMSVIAALGAAIRTISELGAAPHVRLTPRFIVLMGVTAVTLFCAQFLAYAVWWKRGRARDSWTAAD